MLHIDIDPLEALRIYYKGEKLGVWLGDIRKAEKQRKLFLPPLLRDFLLGYGYFSCNVHNEACCFGNLGMLEITDDDLVIFGRWSYDVLLAFRRIDFAEENPQLYCAERLYYDDETADDERPNWSDFTPMEIRMRDFLIMLVTTNLRMKIWNAQEDEELANSGAPAEVLGLLQNDKPEFGRVICWDDAEQELWAVHRRADGRRWLYHFRPRLENWELQELFNQHFYQETDFARALPLAQELINRLRQTDKQALELADLYKLAGRCCWATDRWDEAEEYYQLAEPIFEKRLDELLDKVKYFYQAKGNFYAARQDEAKSRLAYSRVDKICEFVGQGGARAQGMRLVNQAIELVGKDKELIEDLPALQKALELYNQALTIYQQDPKDCKYDIARAQQLRADVRQKLRQLNKPKSS